MLVSWHWHITSVNAANCGTIVLFRLVTSQNTSQKASLALPHPRDLKLPHLALADAAWGIHDMLRVSYEATPLENPAVFVGTHRPPRRLVQLLHKRTCTSTAISVPRWPIPPRRRWPALAMRRGTPRGPSVPEGRSSCLRAVPFGGGIQHLRTAVPVRGLPHRSPAPLPPPRRVSCYRQSQTVLAVDCQFWRTN